MRLPESRVVAARLRLVGSLLLAALAGCTGAIDEGPVTGVAYSGASRFPRLSHDQWENATRDLLRLDEPARRATGRHVGVDRRDHDRALPERRRRARGHR